MQDQIATRASRPFRLRAVLFDFDGTLTQPGALDWALIYREVGCPPDQFVLEWIEALPDGPQRRAALEALERSEMAAAAASRPNHGAEQLVRRLHELDLRVGVLTRNGRAAVERGLAPFPGLGIDAFDLVVTRDDEVLPKPAPDGVLHAAEAMGVAVEEVLMVGDYVFDMDAGRAAGAVTAFLTNGQRSADGVVCDFVVHALPELEDVVRLGLPLPQGKLPNELLQQHLARFSLDDPAVLIPAGIGEDVTALDMTDVEVLVTHGDPITLTGDDLGRYVVHVNANDIVTSGAEPRWLLTTVLLPNGTTSSQALALLADIAETAKSEGISVIGGHTEISDVVARSVVSTTMFGTVSREELRDKRGVRFGDQVILTKQLAVEGTALLAQELGERLRSLGMSDDELAACRKLSERFSIVPEARVARRFAGVRALHDITEGGLATAVRELAATCAHGVTVWRDRIPVFPETRRLCGLLGCDPLGLIGSGSVLICCRPDENEALLQMLHDERIEALVIGEIGERGAGVTALQAGRPAPWPEFSTDEATRLLKQSGPS